MIQPRWREIQALKCEPVFFLSLSLPLSVSLPLPASGREYHDEVIKRCSQIGLGCVCLWGVWWGGRGGVERRSVREVPGPSEWERRGSELREGGGRDGKIAHRRRSGGEEGQHMSE